MTTSDIIKSLRKRRNITQEQLAEALSVERSSVGKYETGTMPSADVLIRIADYFDVSVDYILCHDDCSASFANRLRKIRNESHISQIALAEALSISQQAVAKWESGKSTPNPETVKRISNIMHVSTDYLLGNDTISDSQMSSKIWGNEIEPTKEMWQELYDYAEYIKFKHRGNQE